MIKELFVGKKKLLTIPLAFLVVVSGLPFVIGGFLGYLTLTKVKNEKLKYSLLTLIVLFVLPFQNVWTLGINSKNNTTKVEEAVVVNPALTPQPIMTSSPVLPELTMTPLPTIEPTKKPSPTVPPIKPTTAPKPAATPFVAPPSPAPVGGFACNCSKTCPNISSCAEAQFLLNSCGCSARDADNDGIACDGAPLNCQ